MSRSHFGGPTASHASTVVHDFASFVVFFTEIFLSDEFFTNLGLTDDLCMSPLLSDDRNSTFDVRRYRLQGPLAMRTGDDPYTRLLSGDDIIMKRPRRLNLEGYQEHDRMVSILTEIRTLAHPPLRTHENIIDMLGIAWQRDEGGTEGEKIWPVVLLEYAPFGTLADFCNRPSGPLDYADKGRLCLEVARGLRALHNCGIVHYDIKAENILVCKHRTKGYVAKLSDFGCARIVESEPSEVEMYEPPGTPPWIAPEWSGPIEREKLFKTDYFSYGLLVWIVMLDGMCPLSTNEVQFLKAQSDNELQRKAIQSIYGHSAFSTNEQNAIADVLRRTIVYEPDKRDIGIVEEVWSTKDDGFTMDNAPASMYPMTQEQASEDQFLFDVSEIQKTDYPVQVELRRALETVSGDTDQPQWRQAAAALQAAICHISCIGTVEPQNPGEGAVVKGYTPDPERVEHWLMKAANLGSMTARVFLKRYFDVFKRPLPDCLETWLTELTHLGSAIAAEDLKIMNVRRWKDANELHRTEYCGIGLRRMQNLTNLVLDDPNTLREQISSNIEYYKCMNEEGDSILHFASMTGCEQIVRTVLDQFLVEFPLDRAKGYETPLLCACRSGHYAIAKLLINCGARVDAALGMETPLHWLISFVDEDEMRDIASMLVVRGAHVDAYAEASGRGYKHYMNGLESGTPLLRATARGNVAAVRALLELGADPYNAGDANAPFTRMPIGWACTTHRSDILEIFLQERVLIRPRWLHMRWFRFRDVLEILWWKMFGKTRTAQIGTPGAWAYLGSRHDSPSLVGFALEPAKLSDRILIHGDEYILRMQETLELLHKYMTEDRDWNFVDAYFTPALHAAVYSRDIEIIKVMLQPEFYRRVCHHLIFPMIGARLDEVSLPVQRALRQMDRDAFELLLTETSRFPFFPSRAYYKVNSHGINCLHLCATVSHPDVYFSKRILESVDASEAKRLVNGLTSKTGETPFLVALKRQCFGLADLFLHFGADPEVMCGPDRSTTALGQLIMVNSPTNRTSVRYLLEETHQHGKSPFPPKANFVINRKEGYTALHAACIVSIAYEHRWRANESTYDHASRTLYYLISKAKQLDRLDDQEMTSGRTALHLAVLTQNEVAAQKLIEAGAKADVRSNVDFNGKRVGLSKGLTAPEVASRIFDGALSAPTRGRGNDRVLNIAREIRDLLHVNSPPPMDDHEKGNLEPAHMEVISLDSVSHVRSNVGIVLSLVGVFSILAVMSRRS